MQNKATETNLLHLAAIRGTFGESKTGKLKSLFFSYLFIAVVPASMLFSLFSHGLPSLPVSCNQWATMIMVPTSLSLGTFLLKFTGHKYIFDGNKIQQVTRNGKVWREIEIKKIIEMRVDRRGNTSSIALYTERAAISILLTSDLLTAFKGSEFHSIEK